MQLPKYTLLPLVLCLSLWPPCSASITLATYNLLAEVADPPARLNRWAELIAQIAPDVVLLQEVTQATRKQLETHYKLTDYTYLDKTGGDSEPESGLAILAKRGLSIKYLEFTPLPSNLGRGLLTAILPIAGVPHRLVDVHLESPVPFMRSDYYREQQLKRLDKLARKASAMIIAGDFNLASGDTEERYLPVDLLDVWKLLFPLDPGFTSLPLS